MMMMTTMTPMRIRDGEDDDECLIVKRSMDDDIVVVDDDDNDDDGDIDCDANFRYSCRGHKNKYVTLVILVVDDTDDVGDN